MHGGRVIFFSSFIVDSKNILGLLYLSLLRRLPGFRGGGISGGGGGGGGGNPLRLKVRRRWL